MRVLREWLLVAAAAAAAALVFFHPLLFGGGVFASVDMVKVHVPFRHFIDQSLARGELPLWAPGVWLGAPFLGNGDAALLYPLQFPLFLTDAAHGIGWVIALHAALSVATMYAFTRISLGATPLAAFTAGLLFAFNGYALSHTLYLSEIYVAPWPPLVFLAIGRALSGRLGWALLAPPAIALTVLAGNPQEMFWSAIWLPFLCVMVALRARKSSLVIRGFVVLMVVGVLGLAMAAVQLFPQVELVGSGSRGGGGFGYQQATLFPLAKRVALTLPLPDYLHTFSGENAAWIGLVGTLLVVGAVVRAVLVPGVRLPVAFFVVMALVSAVFALGAATPVYRVLYAVVPGMHQFRFPVRWLYSTTLAFAALGAYGFDALTSLKRERGSKWLAYAVCAAGAAVALLLISPLAAPLVERWATHRDLEVASGIALVLAAAAAIAAWRGVLDARAAFTLIPVAVFIELLGVSQFMEWNHPFPADYYSRVRPLQSAFVSAGPETETRVLPLASSTRWEDSVQRLGPNTNLLLDRDSAYGQGGNWPGGRSVALENDVILPAVAQEPAAAGRVQLWRALGITHVVVSNDEPRLLQEPALERVASDGPFTLLRLLGSVSRAWTTCGGEGVSQTAALAAVLSPSFRADHLFVEEQGAGLTGGPCGSASITHQTANVVDVRINVPHNGWLVLAVSYSKDWQATVDGTGATIFPADYFIQAVRVPAGTHEVTFRYRPYAFSLGVTVSLIALGVWLLGLAATFFGVLDRRRRISSSGRSRARGSR